MSHYLQIIRRAQKELLQLPDPSYTQVRDAIHDLADDPRPRGCRKLTSRQGWRIRVGDYRVIYDIDDKEATVTVINIGHRRDIYKL